MPPITSAAKTGEEYTIKLKCSSEGGPDKEVTVTGEWYQYSLKMLDKSGAPSDDFPEIPGVRSRHQIEEGRTVAVTILYGEMRPYILGEVSG